MKIIDYITSISEDVEKARTGTIPVVDKD